MQKVEKLSQLSAEEIRKNQVLEHLERTKWKRIGLEVLKDWRLYLLLVPLLVFMFLFKYLPIYGILQGFKEYDTSVDLMENSWQGIFYVKELFVGQGAADFWRAFRNTFVTSMYGLIFGFPVPIVLALLFSEVKNTGYRSVLQVCAYLPKFLSTVVVTTIITLWCYAGSEGNAHPGLLTKLFMAFGWIQSVEGADGVLYPANGYGVLAHAKFFRPVFQISSIWEDAGYGSIVYFAAVMAISPTSYEAAKIDGATKLQEIKYVTFPGMAPTLSIMLIMRMGQILNIGYEKVLLLYQKQAYETSDVVSTLIYRWKEGGEAVFQSIGVIADLFNSLIAMVLVLGANAISRRITDTSLF